MSTISITNVLIIRLMVEHSGMCLEIW